jgi:cell division initiation protein
MPLTPDEVAYKRFPIVYGRGYARSEVDEYLTTVADDYSAAIQKIAVAASGGITTEDDIASEMEELLRAAREAATRIKEKARAEADRLTAEAESEAHQQLEQTEKRRADLLGRAETEATKMVEEAEDRARRMREASERQSSEAAARGQERFGSLLEHERELRDRIDVLEELVSEMRAQLAPLEQIDLTDDEDSSAEEAQPKEGAVEQTDSKDPNAGIWDLQERLRQRGGDQSSQV